MKFDEALKVSEVLQTLSNRKIVLWSTAAQIKNFEGKYTVCGYAHNPAYRHERFYVNDGAGWESITNFKHIQLLLERTDWEPLTE